MSEKLEIVHTVKNIETAGQAFGFGFADGFGKVLGWAVVLVAAAWIIKGMPDHSKESPATFQQE